MHARVIALVLGACSGSSKHSPQPAPADTAVSDAEAPVESEYVSPRSEPNWNNVGRINVAFDWERVRERIDASRERRKGLPRPRPCGEHDPATDCSPRPGPLAAWGKLLRQSRDRAMFVLDIGADDGVSDVHWAAVIDELGRPITKYGRVQNIEPLRCHLELDVAELPSSSKFALIINPPARQRMPER